MLKRKNFRLASQGDVIAPHERMKLAESFLEKAHILERGETLPEPFRRDEYTAYGQATLSFAEAQIDILRKYQCKTFAAMVSPDAPRLSTQDYLRRDYAFLFQRFFYYVEDLGPGNTGLLVFDENEKTTCKRLIDRMTRYFLETHTGRQRSTRILPEPLFVHSDLTTAIRLADLVAYCLNWGFRLTSMNRPTRPEMERFGAQVAALRYRGLYEDREGAERPIYGIFYLDELRPKSEREAEN